MTDHAPLGPWVRRFLLEYLVNERNLAANTQHSYRDMLVLLLPFAAQRLVKPIDHLTVDDLSPQLVRAFLNDLEQSRECSGSTRNQRLGAVHALARFIGERSPEHLEWCMQIRLIPFKKTSTYAITYLEKPEIDALLAAPDRNTYQGRRDYALMLFLYNSGARASEAAGLKIADVDWYTHCARILGKGSKQRACPLWSVTMAQLRWSAGQRAVEQPLFLNRNGRPMTRFGIHTMIERNAAKASRLMPSLATKRISPHVIRHTTATHLLRAGVDINTVRAWLGHVSLTTTNIYAETDLETKALALATCAPTAPVNPSKPWREQPELMEFLRSL